MVVIKLAVLSLVLLAVSVPMTLLTGWMCRWVFGGQVVKAEGGVEEGFEDYGQFAQEVDNDLYPYDADWEAHRSTGSLTGNMSPRMRRQGVRQRRRKAGVGEVSHYAKMHSRTRYRL